MRILLVLLLAVAVLLTAMALASTPPPIESRPHTVGTTTIEYVDENRNRPLDARLWYPADSEAKPKRITYYKRAFIGQATRQAAYSDEDIKRALVVISHGDKGNNVNQAWLAEALAAKGYIVAAVDHWQNTTENYTPEASLRVWERPQDLSVVIDRLTEDPTWGPRIDISRIAAAGHSSGGYAAMALAGAIYSPQRMRNYCVSPDGRADCRLANDADLLAIDFSKAAIDYQDDRVKAVFAMAPALGPGIEKASLTAITIPVHIVVAENDEILPFEHHALRYARHIPDAEFTRLEGGGHFVFLPECTFMGKLFTYFHEYDICGRRQGVDRRRPHELVADKAVSWFNQALVK